MLGDGDVLNIILHIPLITCCDKVAGVRGVVAPYVRRASIEPVCGIRSMRSSAKGTIDGHNARAPVVVGLIRVVNCQVIATLCEIWLVW